MKKIMIVLFVSVVSLMNVASASFRESCDAKKMGGQDISKEDISETATHRTFVLTAQMEFNKSASSKCLKDEMKNKLANEDKCTFGILNEVSVHTSTIKETLVEESVGDSSCKTELESQCPYCLIPAVVKVCKVEILVTCQKNETSEQYANGALRVKGIDLFDY